MTATMEALVVLEPNRFETRLARAAAMSFETVDATAADPVAAVRATTGGAGFDVALECRAVS